MNTEIETKLNDLLETILEVKKRHLLAIQHLYRVNIGNIEYAIKNNQVLQLGSPIGNPEAHQDWINNDKECKHLEKIVSELLADIFF